MRCLAYRRDPARVIDTKRAFHPSELLFAERRDRLFAQREIVNLPRTGKQLQAFIYNSRINTTRFALNRTKRLFPFISAPPISGNTKFSKKNLHSIQTSKFYDSSSLIAARVQSCTRIYLYDCITRDILAIILNRDKKYVIIYENLKIFQKFLTFF